MTLGKPAANYLLRNTDSMGSMRGVARFRGHPGYADLPPGVPSPGLHTGEPATGLVRSAEGDDETARSRRDRLLSRSRRAHDSSPPSVPNLGNRKRAVFATQNPRTGGTSGAFRSNTSMSDRVLHRDPLARWTGGITSPRAGDTLSRRTPTAHSRPPRGPASGFRFGVGLFLRGSASHRARYNRQRVTDAVFLQAMGLIVVAAAAVMLIGRARSVHRELHARGPPHRSGARVASQQRNRHDRSGGTRRFRRSASSSCCSLSGSR